MFCLRDVAPRLARARDARVVELREEALTQRRKAVAEMRRQNALLKADRLLAHRELQALRAGMTGDAKYVKRRYRKLDAAQRNRKRIG